MTIKGRDVITIMDFTRRELEALFVEAAKIEEGYGEYRDILRGRVVALLFFEPSTRTRFSFQSALYRLGCEALVFSDIKATSISKGESLGDTIRMMDSYADALVIRHWLEGAAKYAAEVASSPVINAGDGSNHHPTQAMIDLFTIWKVKNVIDGLSIGVLGDLKYGRASNSFIYGLSLYKPKKLYLISPPELKVRDGVKRHLEDRAIEYVETGDLMSALPELDILYVTRIQRERFPDPSEYERVRGSYRITAELLSDVKEGLMIMHPLPRVDEISHDVDETPYAYYFRQAANGIPIRMALLKMILEG